MEKVNLDWGNIGFQYRKTDSRYMAYWKDGNWSEGKLEEGGDTITINQGSPVLHYGQACFEGMKAQTAKDGRVLLFRPDENAKRMVRSAVRISMPPVPEGMFVAACIQTVKANMRWVPPYGSGASLYIRPYQIGIGENIGLKPAPEYVFSIFVLPVGPYFKGGLTPIHLTITEYDRAAPNGTGGVKVGGNYAASLVPHQTAAKEGFAECIYLDPKEHKYIEEVGAANFFGITKDNTFVTPKSPSILPSITKYSLIHIAQEYLKMNVEERPVAIDEIDQFTEAGACGTAAVITPIGSITYNGKKQTYADGSTVGPVSKQLYDILNGIQVGEHDAPEGWLVEVK